MSTPRELPVPPGRGDPAGQLQPPTETGRDQAAEAGKRVVRAAVGAVPVAGSFLAEIADKLIRLPIERRRAAWEQDVATALEEVLARQPEVDLDALGQNEEFVTTVHRATDIAMRTHLDAKREALRNAVVNAALPSAPSSEQQAEFLRMVETLSPTHLRLLRLYNDPRAYFQTHGLPQEEYYSAAPNVLIPIAFPDLIAHEDSWRRAAKQLNEQGLMGGIGAMGTGAGVWNRATTDLGRAFLRFISAPPVSERSS
jgi:hypothetical protein